MRSEARITLVLPPELLSPQARLSRAWHSAGRRKFYERLARQELPDQPFASYFLHIQPEYTVEGVAFEYQDQIALVRNIIAALPADVLLCVKEHRISAGTRPQSFYGELVSIPNVWLLHDTMDSFEIIQRACLNLTLSGTVALESMCFGVPVISFGDVYYEHFRGVHRVRTMAELCRLVARPEKLSRVTRDEILAALAARYACSYDSPYPPTDETGVTNLANALLAECCRRSLLRDADAYARFSRIT
jgi:hypothetical protein